MHPPRRWDAGTGRPARRPDRKSCRRRNRRPGRAAAAAGRWRCRCGCRCRCRMLRSSPAGQATAVARAVRASSSARSCCAECRCSARHTAIWPGVTGRLRSALQRHPVRPMPAQADLHQRRGLGPGRRLQQLASGHETAGAVDCTSGPAWPWAGFALSLALSFAPSLASSLATSLATSTAPAAARPSPVPGATRRRAMRRHRPSTASARRRRWHGRPRRRWSAAGFRPARGWADADRRPVLRQRRLRGLAPAPAARPAGASPRPG